MPKLHILRAVEAADRLLAVTENPRHRFLLHSFRRHQLLGIAGRYEEIFAPEMMTGTPIYHFHAAGSHADLVGRDAIECLYRIWADTSQCVFYPENEEIAVADHFVTSLATVHHQVWGKTLTWHRCVPVLPGFISEQALQDALRESAGRPDAEAMFVYRTFIEAIWRFDDGGRLAGKDIWEPDPSAAQVERLDPGDVIATREAAELLGPLILPLPPFEQAVPGFELITH